MKSKTTYKDAGVDTEKAAELVGDIGKLRQKTEGKRKLYQAFGLFAAGYDLSDYNEPVIMTGCDGVGTKLELLLKYDLLETAGVDLVGMNVNDVLTCNALPIMFLDYIGVPKLDEQLITRLVGGMTDALAACDCVLAGGETAEMPGVVPEGIVELSGFSIGVAEKSELVDPSTVSVGDAIIGVPSDGMHANGFSLVRKILAERGDHFSDEDIIGLLPATRIYYPEVMAFREAALPVKAMAHITGGGIRENLARVLGENGADLKIPYWDHAPTQKFLDCITEETAFHTFNMGIGWMFVLPEEAADALLTAIPHASRLGSVREGSDIAIEVVR